MTRHSLPPCVSQPIKRGMSTSSVLPRTSRALRWVALGVLAVAVAIIALVAGGAFDPRPCGSLARRDTPGRFALAGRGETFEQQPAPFTNTPSCYGVRLTAAHATGEMDSGYGLALGDKKAAFVVAVSPLGEVAVWQAAVGENEPRYLLPWQPWPHVRPGDAPNEIWLDVRRDGERTLVTARLNRELLWEGKVEALYSDAALWLGSFGGSVTLDFDTLDWYVLSEGQ